MVRTEPTKKKITEREREKIILAVSFTDLVT